MPLLDFLFDSYWRVSVEGIERLPPKGGVILVGNHSGGLPFDAVMVGVALDRHGRVARPLYDRFVDGMPALADAYRRAGGVPARYANAEDLVGRDETVVLFPEGVDGIAKLFDERYRLRRFHTSAARLAFENRVPVVPFAVVGAEEAYPMIGRSQELGKVLGAPYLPITPFFPLLGLAGVLPLPTKWSIRFGSPIRLWRESRFRANLDFEAMSERLRRAVDRELRTALERRTSIFLG